MEINCKAWNPDKQETMCQARWGTLEYCKEPFNVTDNAINSVIAALRADGCKQEFIITITLPLDEYRLLISDAQKKSKAEGRKEAWDLARRIVTTGDGCYTIDEVNEAFGNMNILRTPIEEVLAMDKEYQKEKKALHVGDEVEFWDGSVNITTKGYVVNVVSPEIVRVLTKKYGTCTMHPEKCKKTGNHSKEIEKAMASFEEESE